MCIILSNALELPKQASSCHSLDFSGPRMSALITPSWVMTAISVPSFLYICDKAPETQGQVQS